MPTRYEYDLDHNGDWRWIAVADSGETQAISPVGYTHLQDCLHAVGLMQVPGEFLAPAAIRHAQETDNPPEKSLSRLRRS
jgi:uncharacterized protein YegP (UPF0339 family)